MSFKTFVIIGYPAQTCYTGWKNEQINEKRFNVSRDVRKPSSGFPTRFKTNWPVQFQKMARSLKFWLQVEKGLYYPSSENKGADQLRSHCEADLRLCSCIGENLVFSRRGPCGFDPINKRKYMRK